MVAPFSVLYSQDQNKSESEINLIFYLNKKLEELIGVKLEDYILNSMCEKVNINSTICNLARVFGHGKGSEKNEAIVGLFIWCILFNRPHIAKIILPKLKVIYRLFSFKTRKKTFYYLKNYNSIKLLMH